MTGALPAPGRRRGLIEPGNIDLNARPVVRNDDGTISTVLSMSFQDDSGREILVPMVSDDGHVMSEPEAVDNYYQTGRHLGVFDSPKAANAYARKLHDQQGRQYGGAGLPAPKGR